MPTIVFINSISFKSNSFNSCKFIVECSKLFVVICFCCALSKSIYITVKLSFPAPISIVLSYFPFFSTTISSLEAPNKISPCTLLLSREEKLRFILFPAVVSLPSTATPSLPFINKLSVNVIVFSLSFAVLSKSRITWFVVKSL